jgi:hypothetical protein
MISLFHTTLAKLVSKGDFYLAAYSKVRVNVLPDGGGEVTSTRRRMEIKIAFIFYYYTSSKSTLI